MRRLLAALLVLLAPSAPESAPRSQAILVVPAGKGLPLRAGARQLELERALGRAAGVVVRSYDDVCRQILLHRGPADLDAIGGALASARGHYPPQRFDEMVAILTRVEQQRLLELSRPENVRQAAALNQLLGVAHAARGDTAQATERFRTALDLSPGDGIDPLLYPPRVVALFRETAAQRTGSGTVSVDVTSSVPVRSTVDGLRRGPTPLTVQLRPGQHYLRATRLGYRSQARVLEVSARQRSLHLRLEALPPRERPAQLAELLGEGDLDGSDREHLAALASAAGADRLLRWRSAGGRIQAELLGADGASVLGACSIPDHRLVDLWSGLVATRRPPRPAPAPAPVWRRWWFWAAGGAVCAAAVTAIALAASRPDPVLLVRVK